MTSSNSTIRRNALVVQYKGQCGLLVHPSATPRERLDDVAKFSAINHVLKIETCTLHQPGWRTPNAMALETSNTAFDSRRVYIGTGNVIADTMYGAFVRPRLEINCNGMPFAPRKLQAFDLEPFKNLGVPGSLAKLARWIEDEPKFESTTCLAYVIFHVRRESLVIHGALVTDVERKLLKLFDRRDLNLAASNKSDAVLNKACFYLTDACIQDRETVWTRH